MKQVAHRKPSLKRVAVRFAVYKNKKIKRRSITAMSLFL